MLAHGAASLSQQSPRDKQTPTGESSPGPGCRTNAGDVANVCVVPVSEPIWRQAHHHHGHGYFRKCNFIRRFPASPFAFCLLTLGGRGPSHCSMRSCPGWKARGRWTITPFDGGNQAGKGRFWLPGWPSQAPGHWAWLHGVPALGPLLRSPHGAPSTCLPEALLALLGKTGTVPCCPLPPNPQGPRLGFRRQTGPPVWTEASLEAAGPGISAAWNHRSLSSWAGGGHRKEWVLWGRGAGSPGSTFGVQSHPTPPWLAGAPPGLWMHWVPLPWASCSDSGLATAQIQAPRRQLPPRRWLLRGAGLWEGGLPLGAQVWLTSQLTIRLASWHEGEEAAAFWPPC